VQYAGAILGVAIPHHTLHMYDRYIPLLVTLEFRHYAMHAWSPRHCMANDAIRLAYSWRRLHWHCCTFWPPSWTWVCLLFWGRRPNQFMTTGRWVAPAVTGWQQRSHIYIYIYSDLTVIMTCLTMPCCDLRLAAWTLALKFPGTAWDTANLSIVECLFLQSRNVSRARRRYTITVCELTHS